MADRAVTPSSEMNPTKRGLRPGMQLLNHTQCVYMHFGNWVMVRILH